ncbi:hypothetical protein NIES2101_26280 [Calothrix sp. HK-06]|nr:hypothetical protein NIES2101_26280 [Calothrix sp. HK-06]
MALAILRFLETDGGKSRFQIDLGTNRFYQYQIGGLDVHDVNGLKMLQDPIYTSELLSLSPENLGRTIFEVPNNKFDTKHRAIQITSFRDRQQVGPAISEIVTVAIGTTPATSFSLTTAMETAMDKAPIETVPFQYREVQPVSEAMFLGGILNTVKSVAAPILGAVTGAATGGASGSGITGILGSILPQLAGVIAGVLPQLLGGTTGTADGSTPTATGQPPDASQLTNILTGLLQQVGSAIAAPGQTTPVPVTPTVANAVNALVPQPGVTATPRPQPIMNRAPVAQRRGVSKAQSLALSVQNYYSSRAFDENEDEADIYGLSLSSDYVDAMSAEYAESMFIGAILPALGGILSTVAPKLLSMAPTLLSAFGPQLMNIFTSLLNPQTATSGQMSMMLGMDGEDAEDEAVLIALSLAMAASATPDLIYQRVGAVTLEFSDVKPVIMHGRSRFLYRQDQDIAFPLKLETPQPVKKARLQLLIKHPKTLKILIEQNYQIESATSGAVSVVPRISKEHLKKLAPNEEYLVCVSLVWQGRSKKTQQVKRLGTSTIQTFTLVGEYLFDRVENAGEVIPLNNVEKFRSYWHKVWQGDLTENVRRMNFDCKYYYALETKRTENARMETVTQVLEEDLAGRKSRLKSGLIMAPYVLNELLGQISQHPRLSSGELSALMAPEFRKRFNYAARTQVKFQGRSRDTVALWIYPEVKLQQIILKRAENTNAHGHVLGLREHPVYFPMPATAHFIGVST